MGRISLCHTLAGSFFMRIARAHRRKSFSCEPGLTGLSDYQAYRRNCLLKLWRQRSARVPLSWHHGADENGSHL
nr:MAG TPA: hypothetical protein [Caudoviricetes sp.]